MAAGIVNRTIASLPPIVVLGWTGAAAMLVPAAHASASSSPPYWSPSPICRAAPPSHPRPCPMRSTAAGVMRRACETRVRNWR